MRNLSKHRLLPNGNPKGRPSLVRKILQSGKNIFFILVLGSSLGTTKLSASSTNTFTNTTLPFRSGSPLYVSTNIWTLERAVRFALTNSPDVFIAAQRIRQARALLRQANSALWPTVQFETDYMRSDNPVMTFSWTLNQRSFSPQLMGNLNNPDEVDNLGIRGIISYPLYAGGRITAMRRASRQGVRATEENLRAVRNQLAFEVARAYYTVLKAAAFVDAAQAAVRAYESNVQVARHHYETGTLVRADLLDVEVRLAEAKEQLLRARNARELTIRGLANLLGLEPQVIQVSTNLPDLPIPPEDMPIQRPELEALQHQVEAAKEMVRAARSGYFPEIGVFGSVNHNRGWETGGEGTSWMAGIQLRWKVWDGFLTRGKVQEAAARLEQLEEQLRKVRLGIQLEVAQARLNLKQATERVQVSRKAVQQAEESVRLIRVRFAQGLAITTQLINAETALTASRVRLAEAQADRRIAIVALRKALGLPVYP